MAATFETQRAEFDAAQRLAGAIRRLDATPIVDDDYPEVRYDYERALVGLLQACRANGREI